MIADRPGEHRRRGTEPPENRPGVTILFDRVAVPSAPQQRRDRSPFRPPALGGGSSAWSPNCCHMGGPG